MLTSEMNSFAQAGIMAGGALLLWLARWGKPRPPATV
jgi:hypothetical protein